MAHTAVVADDLSGAVETAAAFLSRTSRIQVVLHHGMRPQTDDLDVLAFDTDSRQVDPATADRYTTAALSAAAGCPVVFKKVDSLLRGNLQTELLAAKRTRGHLVMAPALPSASRTVRDGVMYVSGQPLHRTDAWRAEGESPPESVASALSALRTTVLPLRVIRSATLASAVREALSSGLLPICDAESDQDLDRIAAATIGIEDLVLVGSAGLAYALARVLPSTAEQRTAPPARKARRVLVGIGSAAPVIGSQLEAMSELDHDQVLVHPDQLCQGNEGEVAAAIEASTKAVVVVAVDPNAAVSVGRSRDIASGLSTSIAQAARDFDGLLLTGGETARAVLHRLETSMLRPLFEVHHGAVVCEGSDGRLIATRPGSFGDRYSLLSIVHALQDGRNRVKESS